MARPGHHSVRRRAGLLLASGVASLFTILVVLGVQRGGLLPRQTRLLLSSKGAGDAVAAGCRESPPPPVQHWLDAAAAGMAARGANVSDTCNQQFGEAFMQQWLDGEEPDGQRFCAPGADSRSGTVIRCLERASKEDNTWPLCYAAGPMLLGSGSNGSALPQVTYACTRASGNATERLLRRFREHPAPEQLLHQQATFDDSGAVAQQCRTADVISHPVFILSRYDVTNLYHFSEDLVTTFISLHLLQRTEPDAGWEGAQLVIADQLPVGPFLEIWQALFPAHPVRFLSKDPFPDGTCLTRAAFGVAGNISLFSYIWVGNPTQCESVVVQALALFLRRHFGPQPLPPSELQLPGGAGATAGGFVMANREVEEFGILYISRKVFEHIRPGALTGWQMGRVIDNDAEVAAALAAAVDEWNAATCILGPDDIPWLEGASVPDRRLLVREQIQRQLRRRAEQQRRRRRRRRRRLLADEQPRLEQALIGHGAEESVRSEWRPSAARQLQGVGDEQSTAAQDGEQPQAGTSGGEAEQAADSQPDDQQQGASDPGQPGCRPGRLLFRLRTMELSLSPLRDQLQAVTAARILVGGHGAALTDVIAMQPGAAALLEVQLQGYSGNHHYQRLATYMGAQYRVVEDLPPPKLKTGPVVAALSQLMDSIAEEHYMRATGQPLQYAAASNSSST